MRSTAVVLGVLVVAAAGVVIWQRSQISALRTEMGAERAALADERDRLDSLASRLDPIPISEKATRSLAAPVSFMRTLEASGALRADERRVILAQYRDVLAEANLPEGTASHLQDLLTDRVEAFLDAQDAARREGFAEGSAEMERAVALAIAEDDRQISQLMTLVGAVRAAPPSAPAPAAPWDQPAAAAPTVVVTVVTQAPAETPYPNYVEAAPAPEAAAPYLPFYTYPSGGYFIVGGLSRPSLGPRPGLLRYHRGAPVARTHIRPGRI
ncbi:MAG TPA: hypothetical protein VGF85_00360 [Opitutaceae bacterium]|jgi:hypothetical protein